MSFYANGWPEDPSAAPNADAVNTELGVEVEEDTTAVLPPTPPEPDPATEVASIPPEPTPVESGANAGNVDALLNTEIDEHAAETGDPDAHVDETVDPETLPAGDLVAVNGEHTEWEVVEDQQDEPSVSTTDEHDVTETENDLEEPMQGDDESDEEYAARRRSWIGKKAAATRKAKAAAEGA